MQNQNKSETFKKEEETKTISLQLFMKNGGNQPSSYDPKEINQFFTGNIAKVWAMTEGFMPKFKSYKNGEIVFDLITDPRYTKVFYISLCKFIGSTYKKNVDILKDAILFQADHYIANDSIGFNLIGEEKKKLEEYQKRIKASYDSLPSKPNMIHYGKII